MMTSTTRQGGNSPQLRSLDELIAVIERGEVIVFEAYQEIYDRNLYLSTHETWKEFLQSRGKTLSWWKQTKASAKAILRCRTEHGVELGNDAAARDVRKILHNAVSEDILPRVLAKAQALAKLEHSPVMGRHIKAVVRTFCLVLDTGGYVWIEGHEEMVAFNAACVWDAIESLKRQRQYARNGAQRNGWSAPIRVTRNQGGFPVDELPFAQICSEHPPGTTIEIKWRVVEPPTLSDETTPQEPR
jgi:hypothetical protein